MELKINNSQKNFSTQYNSPRKIINDKRTYSNFQDALNSVKKGKTNNQISNYISTESSNYLKDREITDPDALARLKALNESFNTPESRKYSIKSIDMIENVMKLDIPNNKDRYCDSTGKINIEKVFNDCGISLENCTSPEALAIFSELRSEKLLDQNTYDKVFIATLFLSGEPSQGNNFNLDNDINQRTNFSEHLYSALNNNPFGEFHDLLSDIINLIE